MHVGYVKMSSAKHTQIVMSTWYKTKQKSYPIIGKELN